jgi:glycosyltransferase involved in cell wall biosynthesis
MRAGDVDREPLVSIGMPVHDGADYIETSIGDLLAQTYPNIEIVISENASTDGTATLCDEIAARDRRVRVVHQPSLLPASANFAAVLQLARGDLFMFAAVDDRWHPDFVGALVAALRDRPDARVAMSAVDHVWWDGRDAPEPVRYVGRHDPTRTSHLVRALRQAGGTVPYFQYIYGLHRRPFIDQAFAGLPDVVSADGLYVIQLALAAEWAYVDRVLTTRLIREQEWAARYEADPMAVSMRDPHSELRLLAAAPLFLARSRVIPWRRKLWIPPVLVRLAMWRLPIWIGVLRRRARRQPAAG